MAQYNLGKMLWAGQGVKKNEEQARQWYEAAAKKGSPSAIHELLYIAKADFKVMMEDADSRAQLIKQAQENDPKSQYMLGQAYLQGIGVNKDQKMARKWILQSAKSGYADAQYAVAYLFSVQKNIQKTYTEPLEWTKKAAKQGHRFAAFNLGGVYESGIGADKNWMEAGRWYLYSAGLGNANAIKRLNIMADVCRRFPERRECKGFMLRDLAIEGPAESLFQIGLALKDGDGIEQSYLKSIFWLKFAAGKDHIGAQYELGDIYENALGVGRSAAQAKFWYAKAAEKGHAESLTRLKKMKEDKEGEQ